MLERIPLCEITVSPRYQLRALMSEETLSDYQSLLQESPPDSWPFKEPVRLMWVGGKLVLINGYHRVEAAKRAGRDVVSAEIREGDERDCLLAALRANADHGLPRNNADKRRVVLAALSDTDIAGMSDRLIAKMCCVSDMLVGSVRRASTASGLQLADSPRIGADGKVRRLPERQEYDDYTARLLAIHDADRHKLTRQYADIRSGLVWSLWAYGWREEDIAVSAGLDVDHVGRILRPLDDEYVAVPDVADNAICREHLRAIARWTITTLLSYPGMPQDRLQAALEALGEPESISGVDSAKRAALECAAARWLHSGDWPTNEEITRAYRDVQRCVDSEEHQRWSDALPQLMVTCRAEVVAA